MSVPASLIQDFIDLGLHLLYALIILGVGMRLVKPLCRRFANSRLIAHLDPSTANFLCNSSRLVLRAAVIVIAALVLGIPGSAFITVFGSAGVAIGLALQGSLSNLAGGLMLLFFRPFTVGDFIETSGGSGTVTQISAFYTTIRTSDCKRIVLPNGAHAQLLDVMDYVSNFVLMPVVAIATCVLVGWVLKPKSMIEEVVLGGLRFGRERLYVVMIKVVTPIMLLFLLLQSLGIFNV